MPENVVFTKMDEATDYASDIGGQVVEVEDGWRVMGIGYHEGGPAHKHPHTEAEEKSTMWEEIVDFGKKIVGDPETRAEKGKLVTRIMKNTRSTSDSMAASLLSLSLSELKKRDSKIAKDLAEKNLADEMAEQKKAGERAREGQNMGGMVDELGYMHGGMAHGKRDPIKYASGGAVRGKRFVGTF